MLLLQISTVPTATVTSRVSRSAVGPRRATSICGAPQPERRSTPGVSRSLELDTRMSEISAVEYSGKFSISRAAKPEMFGAAIDVPV